MRLAVVSPFLDRQHGTELCVSEQIERLARQYHWSIDLYSQKVSQLSGVRPASGASHNSTDSILWHKVSDIPGPHLLKYLWWFSANHWQRWRDRRSGRVRPDLVYSPGINCFDADVIVVHIVFHAFYERVRSELSLNRVPLQSWPRLIHRKLYYKLVMFLERKGLPQPRCPARGSILSCCCAIEITLSDETTLPSSQMPWTPSGLHRKSEFPKGTCPGDLFRIPKTISSHCSSAMIGKRRASILFSRPSLRSPIFPYACSLLAPMTRISIALYSINLPCEIGSALRNPPQTFYPFMLLPISTSAPLWKTLSICPCSRLWRAVSP